MPVLIESVDLVTNFYTYEGVVRALNGVGLRMDHGQTFGLVGESGCGKSVFVRSLMQIVQVPGRIETGNVFFFPEGSDGEARVDLLEQSERYMEEIRGDRISMIFQEPNAALNPIMSIGEQVAESFLFHRKRSMCRKILGDLESPDCTVCLPVRKYLHAVYRIAARRPEAAILKILEKIPILKWWKKPLMREAIERSVDIIGKLGIPHPEEVVKRHPHNLSGGMKQRIVIAIALACRPVLLIADEATSNLDVTIQAQILELLKKMKREAGSSVLLITHDLGVVAETCDRVGVMYAGNLCEVAGVDILFREPLHPYTHALLNSVPRLSQEGELRSIEGNVPNLVNPPSGCRFHPRCGRAVDACTDALPELADAGGNHYVACHNPIPGKDG